jgi:hypothetical protein
VDPAKASSIPAEVGLTEDFSEPYYGGIGVVGPDLPPGSSMVVLDGWPFLVDRKSGRFKRLSENIVGQRDVRPGEASLVQTDVYRRSFESWHMGCGQDFTDRDESNMYQFLASKGVDPWNKFALTLLPDTVLRKTATEQAQWAVIAGSELVHVHGTTLEWYDSITTGSPVTETLSSAVAQASTNGSAVVAVCVDGHVRVKQRGIAEVDFAPLVSAWDVAGGVKGRTVATTGPEVYDLTSGTPELVWQHPDPLWKWDAVGDGLTAIYLAGHSGDKSGIYRFRSKEDGTGLDVGIQAAQLPDGERCVHVGYYLGYSVIGTTLGVRFGSSDSQGNIVLGSLLETPRPVLCSEGQGRFVWFGWSNFDAESTGLGRMDPSKFTDPLTPAYASDLMAEGQGDVTSVVTLDGKRVFTVAGSGLWAESDERVPEGWLETGWTSWNVPDEKRGAYVMVRHAPLRGEIEADSFYDGSSTWTDLGGSITQGSSKSPNLTLAGSAFSSINLRAVLRRDEVDKTVSPVLTRLEIRAVPVSGRASVWQVPLIVSERVEWAGVTTSWEPEQVADRLVGLCETGRPFLFRDGANAWQVQMIDYEWAPEKQASDSNGWAGIFLAVCREIR